jgi:hypothetical protein
MKSEIEMNDNTAERIKITEKLTQSASVSGGRGNEGGEPDFEVGDQVRLVADSLAWKAEMKLRSKIGQVVERRPGGRISVRYGNGRLLMGRDAKAFEHAGEIGLKAKGK